MRGAWTVLWQSVVLAAILSGTSKAEESRWALLVGIDDYIDPGISDLTGSVNDVEALHEALVTAARFPSEQVFLLRSNDPGNEPSRSNILTKLRYIADKADSDDLVFVHFSLHAVFDEETDSSYLLTSRSDPKDIARYSLAMGEVTELIEGMAAPKRLVVLDGCRNTPERGRGDAPNLLDARFSRGLVITPRKAPAGAMAFTQVIYACSPGQRAYEWPGRDRGLFSVALEEGLRGVGEADGGDGQVTLGELSAYLRWRVPDLLAQHLPGRMQSPEVPVPPAGAREYAFSEAQRSASPAREADLPAMPRRVITATTDLDPVFVRKVAKEPTVKFTAAPTAPLTRAQARTLTLRWEADVDRGVKGYRWRLDDGDVQESGRVYADLSAAEPGTHTFQVQVQDFWGNWSAPAKVEFEVLANRRPYVGFASPSPGARVRGERLAVVLEGTDPDGRIVKWRLALDDPDEFLESSDGRFDLPGPVDGLHTLFSQAIDDEGSASLWQSLAVRFAYTEPERDLPAEGGATTGRATTRTSPDAHSWTKGQPAPEVEGFSMVGNNTQGYPEYDKALPGGATMRFVLVPAGSFTMGSPSGESDRGDDEGPQHQVTLDAFLLAKTECTQRQWQAVMGSNPSYFTSAGMSPVEQVSWDDILAFRQKTGLFLPSEAQWEYAARAGSTAVRYSDLDIIAWYQGNSNERTHAVGYTQANAFGLHDMLGNVWEWCEDTWHGSYSGAPSSGSAWVDNGSPLRVSRGGGFLDVAQHCRSANRYRLVPGLRADYLGFRPSSLLR
jgi:formylglycine-generating enzyme required for sulfatase activity/uncharacterized caspase-like protein